MKPENILLDDAWNVKVADFGIAKEYKRLEYNTHHVTQRPSFTPGYGAPALLNQNERSVKTDLFAYGIILLQLATGTHPQIYDGDHYTNYHDFILGTFRSNINELKRKAVSFNEQKWRKLIMLGAKLSSPRKQDRGTLAEAQQELRNLGRENTTSSSSVPVSTTIEAKLCLICYANPRNARFIPCGHATCCSACIPQINPKKCVTCRADFTGFTLESTRSIQNTYPQQSTRRQQHDPPIRVRQQQPQPVSVPRQPVRVQPQPVRVQPQPVRVQPQPVRVQPQPVRVQPQPVRVQPQPAHEEPNSRQGLVLKNVIRPNGQWAREWVPANFIPRDSMGVPVRQYDPY